MARAYQVGAGAVVTKGGGSEPRLVYPHLTIVEVDAVLLGPSCRSISKRRGPFAPVQTQRSSNGRQTTDRLDSLWRMTKRISSRLAYRALVIAGDGVRCVTSMCLGFLVIVAGLSAYPGTSSARFSSGAPPYSSGPATLPIAHAELAGNFVVSITTPSGESVAVDFQVSTIGVRDSGGKETFLQTVSPEIFSASTDWYVVLRGESLDKAASGAMVVRKEGVSGIINHRFGDSIRVDGGPAEAKSWLSGSSSPGRGQPLRAFVLDDGTPHTDARKMAGVGNLVDHGSGNSIVVSKHIYMEPGGQRVDPVNVIFYGDMAEGTLLLTRNQWYPTTCSSVKHALILDASHGGSDAWVTQDNDYERDGLCVDARHHARRYSAHGDWHSPGFGFYALVPVHWECFGHPLECVDPQRGQDRLYSTVIQDPRVKGITSFRPDSDNLDCTTCSRWNGWIDMYWVEHPDSTNVDPCGAGKTASIEFSGTIKMLRFGCLGSGGGGGGGSPFVAPWNGVAYVEDNNILPLSEEFDRTTRDVVDHYRLHASLMPVGERYSLKLVEFEEERSFFDSISLWVVDHDSDVRVGINPQTGTVITYEDPEPPNSAVDNYNRNVLGALIAWDGNFHEGWRGDFVELTFGRVKRDDARLLIVADTSHKIKTRIFVQVWNGTGWEVADTMHHRTNFAEDIVDLSPYVPASGLRIRLLGASRFALEQVGIDTSPSHTASIQVAPLLNAVHSSGLDLTSPLTSRDGAYGELAPGEDILSTFGVPPVGDEARSFVFVSSGHYTHKYQPLQGTEVSIYGLSAVFRAIVPEASPGPFWELEITELVWAFGDGNGGVSGLRVAHSYSHSGEYVVTVRVTYPDGHVKLDRRVIVVSD
jgi:hypothetical protein